MWKLSARFIAERWLINGVALWIATWILPDIQMPADIAKFVIVLVLFGLINDLVRSIDWLLTCPVVLVTLLPLTVLLNMLILLVTAWLSGSLGMGLRIEGVVSVFWAAVLVTAVRFILTEMVRLYEGKRACRRQRQWIAELERAKVWLAEQGYNWKREAQHRGQIIEEQEAWILELQRGKAWLAEQTENWRRITEQYSNRGNS